MFEMNFFDISYLFSSPNSPVAIVIVFVFASLIGSFINVCAYRLPLGRSIVSPGSACTSCGEAVKWYFNIPILSYIFLRGRCDSCASPFSYRYALIELITALLGVMIYLKFYPSLINILYYFIFAVFLIVIFLIDLDHWLILDSVSVPAIIVGLAGSAFVFNLNPYDSILYLLFPELPIYANRFLYSFCNSLLGVGLGYLLFTMIAFWGTVLMRQEAMGGGDIKLAMILGAFLGLEKGALALVMSFFIGFIFVIPFILFMKKSGREPLAFGTFMALAGLIVLIYGDSMINKFIGF